MARAADAATCAPEADSAAAFLPARRSLRSLTAAARGCRGCDLYCDATQTVFGAGPARARMVVVGETPGDVEDREGKPFVGPAGRLLDAAFAAAGLARRELYLTNAVKHFKFEPRGKRRIHSRPNRYEIEACKPWLVAELEVIEPDFLLLLGAIAAQTLLGPAFRVTKQRGTPLTSPYATTTMATVHPASVLRARPESRAAERARFFADIAAAAKAYRG